MTSNSASRSSRLSRSARRRTRKIIQSIPSIRSLSRKNCPAGYIRKKGYVRKYSTAVKERGYTVKKKNGKEYRIRPKASEMYVEPKCVKNMGLPGKGPALFGPLKKGELAKYGYSFRRSEAERHAALRKAIEEYGPTSVYHKLNAAAKLTKRAKNKKISQAFKEDSEWVTKQTRQ